MRRVEKTVFISYRRSNIYTARAVHKELTTHGYDAFLDYQNIDSGAFDQIILHQIAARAHFVLILEAGALERCVNPDDWLRREIEHAIDLRRNIVPLMFEGFNIKELDTVSGKLDVLKTYNGMKIYPDYFDEAMERLRTRFLNIELEMVLHPTPSNEVGEIERRKSEFLAVEPVPPPASAPAVSSFGLTAEQHIEQAEKHLEAENYQFAVEEYSEALKLKPDAKVYFARAEAEFKKRPYSNNTNIIADYDQVIRLQPDNAEAYFRRGQLRLNTGHAEDATRDFNQVIRLQPDNAEVYNARGKSYARKWLRGADGKHIWNHSAALRDYDKAIQLKPGFVDAYYNRGRSRRDSGDTAGALKDFDHVIRLDPRHTFAFEARGEILLKQNNLHGALQDFSQVLRLSPRSGTAYEKRGDTYYALQDYARAVADYEQAAKLPPLIPHLSEQQIKNKLDRAREALKKRKR